jgi:hypothetical protein
MALTKLTVFIGVRGRKPSSRHYYWLVAIGGEKIRWPVFHPVRTPARTAGKHPRGGCPRAVALAGVHTQEPRPRDLH